MQAADQTQSFDDRAQTWDNDPMKRQRALAVAEAMRQRIPLSPTWRSLEYGCGTGLLSFALYRELGHITLADSSPGMLAVLEQKILAAGAASLHPRVLDLSAEAPPNERYELIYTLLTLHHVPDTDGLLRAFYALLNPGGWLAIADLDQEDGSFHGADFDGHHGFDRARLGAQLIEARFSAVDFSTPCVIQKSTAGDPREYPVFLAVSRRS